MRPADYPAFAAILGDTLRLRDSHCPELVLAVATFLPEMLTLSQAPLLPPLPGWRLDGDGTLSHAGIRLDFVAKPIWLLIALLWIRRAALPVLPLRMGRISAS